MAKLTATKRKEVIRHLENAENTPYITNTDSAGDAHNRIDLLEAVKLILEAL
jgi:hypothetical protein